jgi:hypothetical protein
LLSPELDNDAKDKINVLLELIKTKQKEFADKEIIVWKEMLPQVKRDMASKGYFPLSSFIVLPLYQEMMTKFQLDVYKKIFVELNLLLSRIKYFKKKVKFG